MLNIEKIKNVKIEDEAAFFDLFDKTARGNLLFYTNDKHICKTPEFSFFAYDRGEDVKYFCNSEKVSEYFIKRNMNVYSEQITYQKI